ncbi:MAG: phosphohydrolase, partial [Allomuricauda sp.]
MGKTLDNVYKHQSLAYKYFLYLVSVALIVFFFPKGGKFKYEFQKGKPWQYENLYAPIDFSIKKTTEEIAQEQQSLRDHKTDYYTYDAAIPEGIKEKVAQQLQESFNGSTLSVRQQNALQNWASQVIDSVYDLGIFQELPLSSTVRVVKNNEARTVMSNHYLNNAKARNLTSRLLP